MKLPRRGPAPRAAVGMTLVEVLVTVAILAIVASIALVALRSLRISAAVASTSADLRGLGQYVSTRVVDHGGLMPRSRHSGANFAYPERLREIWGFEYFGFVGARGSYLVQQDRVAFINEWLRSPLDPRSDAQEGYGFNVYFELRGAGDEDGAAETVDGASWRRYSAAPAPASTVLFGEIGVPPADGGTVPQPRDHFMAHFWSQFAADTTYEVRREPPEAPPVFCHLDGHVESRSFESTFRRVPGGPPESQLDRWNPATAGSRSSE
ncbi:MAG: hypothetical protein RI967_2532 [Planctomycetota bacterium]